MKFLFKHLPFMMVLALLALAAPHAGAQSPGSHLLGTPDSPEAGMTAPQATVPKEPNGFGTNMQYTYIHASSFLPWNHQVLPDYVSTTGYITPHDDGSNYSPAFWAQIHLPNGAQIDNAYVRAYDNASDAYWKMMFTTYEHDGTPSFVTLSNTSAGESSSPGYFTFSAIFSSPPLIREWVDMDSDGLTGDLAFTVNMVPQGTYVQIFDNLRLGGISIGWHRTISPAPTTATFSDVPTDHWAFKFVEALAASGITAGCGGGKYCPDDPITRGQMAVYLAAALGLHWSL